MSIALPVDKYLFKVSKITLEQSSYRLRVVILLTLSRYFVSGHEYQPRSSQGFFSLLRHTLRTILLYPSITLEKVFEEI